MLERSCQVWGKGSRLEVEMAEVAAVSNRWTQGVPARACSISKGGRPAGTAVWRTEGHRRSLMSRSPPTCRADCLLSPDYYYLHLLLTFCI